MRITFVRKQLVRSLRLAAAATNPKCPKEIIQFVKLEAEKNAVRMTACDIETTAMRVTVPQAHVEEPGALLVHPKRLLPALNDLADHDLVILDGDGMLIGQNSKIDLGATFDPAEFPAMPDCAWTHYHTVDAGWLDSAIRRTIFAAAEENARYSLTGVLWELEGEKARLVATDGRRLSIVDGPAAEKAGHSTKGHTCVVPAKAMKALWGAIDGGECQAVFSPSASKDGSGDAFFRTANVEVYARLVAGRYPPYREVVPKKCNMHLEMPVGFMLDSVKKMAKATTEEIRGVDFRFRQNVLTMTTTASKTTAEVRMACGYEFDISLNPKFLIDYLRTVGEQNVVFEAVDSSSALTFRADGTTHIIMPLTTDKNDDKWVGTPKKLKETPKLKLVA